MLCVFLCSLFFIATRDRGSSSSSPAMCNRPLQLPSLLQSLSSSPSPSPSPSMVCVDTNLLLFHSHSHPGQSISMWRKYLIFSPHFLISFFPSSSFLLFLFFVVFCFWAAFCLSFFPFRLFSVFFLFSCCTQFLPLHFYWLHLRRATAYMCVRECVPGISRCAGHAQQPIYIDIHTRTHAHMHTSSAHNHTHTHTQTLLYIYAIGIAFFSFLFFSLFLFFAAFLVVLAVFVEFLLPLLPRLMQIKCLCRLALC